jgi:uncharacterized protein (DUF342 family)
MHDNDSVVTEANTVEEAVEKALKILQVSRELVKIEVVSEAKQGFMGLGNKSAKVKVTMKAEAKTELELTDLLIDLDIKDEAYEEKYIPKVTDAKAGVAQVKDGQVLVTDPKDVGKYATIRSGQKVRLKVNGKEITEEVPITQKDTLEIEYINEEPVSTLELTVSEDKLQAYLRWVYGPGVKYKLKDQPETNCLVLLTEAADIVELPPMTLDAMAKFLQDNGISRGVVDEELQAVLQNPNSKEPYLVAKGLAPVDGVDAYIRYPFEEKEAEDTEEGLFGRHKLISVNPGEVLAFKVPKQEGQDGWAVTGEGLKAKQAADIDISVKAGCEVIEGGCKAVAIIAGRPGTETVGNRTLVFVNPILEMKEVDQSSGNIRFAGDVQVRGSVRDGLVVEADGNIEVFGEVTRATLKAGSSVIIHKVALASTIIAGGRAALYSSILPSLSQINSCLEKLWMVAAQLQNAPGFRTSDLQAKGDGTLIQLLCDSKFPELPKLVADTYKTIFNCSITVHEEISNLIQGLHKHLCGLGPTAITKLEFLKVLHQCIAAGINLANNFVRREDCVKVRYIQNCVIMSSGDVLVEGQGCYISNITAGGEVIVDGNPGIASGVNIVSNGDVIVKELGSDFDTQTSVRIKGNGKVSADLIHPNVVIQIENEKCRVDNLYQKFKAYNNYEGRLIIEKLTAEKH